MTATVVHVRQRALDLWDAATAVERAVLRALDQAPDGEPLSEATYRAWILKGEVTRTELEAVLPVVRRLVAVRSMIPLASAAPFKTCGESWPSEVG